MTGFIGSPMGFAAMLMFIVSAIVVLIPSEIPPKLSRRNSAPRERFRRIVDMSPEERLDEQRKVIADRGETHAVEFIARMSTASTRHAMPEDTLSKRFAEHVARELDCWLPLGGRIQRLDASKATKGTTFTAHCIADLEVRKDVDAHEVAEQVCRSVRASDSARSTKDYMSVTFMPVVQKVMWGAREVPGLWGVIPTRDTTPRRYSHVVTRSNMDATRPPTTAETASSEWEHAARELARVTSEFASFEFSPMDVAITRRLLWDLTEPSTARFYEAFDTANMLKTNSAPKDAAQVSAFVEASRIAVAAWEAADRNARDKAEQNIGSGGQVLTAERVRHRDTAASAMALALDPASTDAEAGTAWRTSMDALDRAGLLVPASKLEKLKSTESVSRALRALTAGEG